MTPALAEIARAMVAAESSAEVAANAVTACDRLAHHLARVVGELGIRTLLARSVALTSAKHPWLANAITRMPGEDAPWAGLDAAFALQPPATGIVAFGDLLSTFVELLSRLIGDSLVVRLLHEVWPEKFPDAAKETT